MLISGGAFDVDFTEHATLLGPELVHFHELEEGKEGYDNFDLGGCLLEDGLE